MEVFFPSFPCLFNASNSVSSKFSFDPGFPLGSNLNTLQAFLELLMILDCVFLFKRRTKNLTEALSMWSELINWGLQCKVVWGSSAGILDLFS